MVVMGVVALFNPFGSSTVLMMFVGIVLMVEGLSDLISIIRISSFIKNLRDSVLSGGGIEFVSGIIKINTIIEVVIVTAVINELL